MTGQGGSGCVFHPMLRCRGRMAAYYHPSYVSKIMTTKNSKAEIAKIAQASRAIRGRIRDPGNYFVGFSPGERMFDCTAEPLSDANLQLYAKECTALRRQGYASTKVNSLLNQGELRILNTPYGGVHLGDAVKTAVFSGIRAELEMVRSLQRLSRGVGELHQCGIIHGDIKPGNVVVSVRVPGMTAHPGNAETIQQAIARLGTGPQPVILSRLIDWGETIFFRTDSVRGYPAVLSAEGVPLRWNSPVSIILFLDLLQAPITDAVGEAIGTTKEKLMKAREAASASAPACGTVRDARQGADEDKEGLREVKPYGTIQQLDRVSRAIAMQNVAARVYQAYRRLVGSKGHDQALINILKDFYSPLATYDDRERTYACSGEMIIINYLAKVLDVYVGPDNVFDRARYFKEVFSYNMDAYGMIMCYLPMASETESSRVREIIAEMLVTFCFSTDYAAEPIDWGTVNSFQERLEEALTRFREPSPPPAPPVSSSQATSERHTEQRRRELTSRKTLPAPVKAPAPARPTAPERGFYSARLERVFPSAPAGKPGRSLDPVPKIARQSAPGRVRVPRPREPATANLPTRRSLPRSFRPRSLRRKPKETKRVRGRLVRNSRGVRLTLGSPVPAAAKKPARTARRAGPRLSQGRMRGRLGVQDAV